ncbi:DEAD/DEAH box helicase [Suttonella ornithocola]|nr:3'-5' exonuclease [Suttonella ornithocola]
MDNQQESTARRLGAGHRVFHGCAGSGKSLLLIHRARKLAHAQPDKPILVLCFNKSLAAFLKAQLQHPKIHVYHYHGWCIAMRDLYGLYVSNDAKEGSYPERLTQAIDKSIVNGKLPKGQYSAVLIDEGHDFAEDWLRTAVSQAEGKDGQDQNFLLLYDDAQSIYDNRTSGLNFSLKSVDIAAQGRSVIFSKNYRNSQEILQYAANFLTHYVQAHSADEDSIPLIIPKSIGIETNLPPVFKYFSSRAAEMQAIIEDIQNWQQQGVPFGNIALLCNSTRYGRSLISKLRAHNITIQDLIESDNRLDYHKDENALTVCTMHSSKGLEFERVIIAEIDGLKTSEDERAKSARLLYVAMTRAKTHLILTAAKETSFTQTL